MDLNGISAVVTGAASGLGAATAAALSDAGVKVAIFDRDAEKGEAFAKEINGVFCEVDVTDPASVGAGFDKARAANGPERLAVNCAGVAFAAKTVDRDGNPHDAELFQKTVGVNLIGTFNVASQAAAGMTALDPLDADGSRGVIINTASIAAMDGQIGQIAYAASKGGVAAMTLPMARDLHRLGVRVVAIAPGLFLTPMLQSLPKEAQDSLGAQVPFPSRLGDPGEYAALVMAVAQNNMLNGETIRLDGALRMAPK
ncbi:SDR family NAD(P)-dependent oxidoreductase [Paracoccaceae bacterium GXU_MW_L88]